MPPTQNRLLDTRNQIRDKGIELRDLTSSGREKIKEIKQHSQKLAIEQLDHITDAVKVGKKKKYVSINKR